MQIELRLVISWPYVKEVLLGYLGEPNVITRFFKAKREAEEERQRQRQRCGDGSS